MTPAITVILVLAVVVACENPTADDSGGSESGSGGSGSGTLTVSSTAYELTKLYIDHEGYDNFDLNYDIDLLIYSEEVSYDGNSNSGSTDGSGVALDMAFSADEVVSGSYSFSTGNGDDTFSDYSDAFTSPGSYREYFAGGTVDISVDGGDYTIEGSVTDDNGDTVTFSYDGPVTEVFQSDS